MILVGDDGSDGAKAAEVWASRYAAATEAGEVKNVHVRIGSASAGLISASRERVIDLIVLGRRGSGGFPALRLGSTAHQLAEHSRCPVAVVPSDAVGLDRPPSRIAVGADASSHSLTAIRWTARLAAVATIPVWAVHALDLGPAMAFGGSDDSLYDQARYRVAEQMERSWCAPLREAGVDHQTVLSEGGAGTVLLDAVRAHHIDLLVVGRRTPSKITPMGNVAHRAIAYSPCTTVVVPDDLNAGGPNER